MTYRRKIAVAGVLTLLILVAGMAAHRAEPKVGLGDSAARVVELDGHPVKIDFGPDQQIWKYRSQSGSLENRYHLNQGLVVRIRGR